MDRRKVVILVVVVAIALTGFWFRTSVQAAPCAAFIGEWAWFNGGVVTIKPDQTMVWEQANDGTWSCSDPERGVATLRWRLGGFVNTLAVTADGSALSSTDPAQWYVTATRTGAPSPQPLPAPVTEGEREVASENSEETGRLLTSINHGYPDSLWFDFRFPLDFGVLRKGREVTLNEDFSLAIEHQTCEVAAASGITFGARVCGLEGGLPWQDSTSIVPLAQVDPRSMKVSTELDEEEQAHPYLSWEYRSGQDSTLRPDGTGAATADADVATRMGCIDVTACAQMGKDLQRLIAIAQDRGGR